MLTSNFLSTAVMDPTYEWPLKFCAYSTCITYVLSLITGNVSQVDRLWSVLPTIYAGYFALLPLWPRTEPLPLFPYTPASTNSAVAGDFSPRALLMFGLTLVWTSRLTYNTFRKGLFNWTEEDYRWEILRQKLPKWLFQVFNLTFIAVTQNVLLLVLAIPVHTAVHQPHTPLAASDYILFTIGLAVHLIEFTADNQHQSFHHYKHSGAIDSNEWLGARIQWTPADAKRGFCSKGLWAWSRHPNFLCEQLCWIIINFIPLFSPDSHRSATISTTTFWDLGPSLAHCFLFFNSTTFSESISSSKYPAYAAYQQRVSMFVPWLTPVWGFILRGKKEEVDQVVYGNTGTKQD